MAIGIRIHKKEMGTQKLRHISSFFFVFKRKSNIVVLLTIVASSILLANAISNGNTRKLSLLLMLIVCAAFSVWIFNAKEVHQRLAKVYSFFVFMSFLAIRFGYKNITLPESAMFYLCVFTLLLKLYKRKLFSDLERNEIAILVSAAIFCLGGIISMEFTHYDINSWVKGCAIPFIVIFLIIFILKNVVDADRFVFFSSMAVTGFILLIFFSLLTGLGTRIPGTEFKDQLAVQIHFAGIDFETYATWLGAVAAMIFPLNFISAIFFSKLSRLLWYLLSLAVSLVFYYYTFTRAGAIAILVAFIFIIAAVYLGFRDFRGRLYKTSFIVTGFFLLMTILLGIGQGIFNNFQLLYYYGTDVPNIAHRINLLSISYGNLLHSPLGMGFNTLWIRYGIDEVNYFSWIANGVGVIGLAGLFFVLAIISTELTKGLFHKNRKCRFYAILGISTLLSTLIAANANDQILWRSQSTIPFWTISMTSFKVCSLYRRAGHQGVKESHSFVLRTNQEVLRGS